MNKIDGGAIIWARQTIDSKIFYDKPDKWFKIWFYLVARVNHTDNERFKRGTCFLKYDWIMNATGASKDEVKHCIKFLKDSSMLATQKATRGFTVEVLKYKHYQNLDSYKSHTKSHRKATQKPHRSHTINKNVKNGKNDNKIYSVFDFWNSLKIIVHKNIKGKVGNRTFKGCLEQALNDNNEETVREAMQNYKTILEGEEYFWKYRWTIGEFLIRGLDKFLTINKPFENFAIKEREDGRTNQRKQHYRTDRSRKKDKYKDLYEA